jgi:HlyD family type I secretion membrane fusion protein
MIKKQSTPGGIALPSPDDPRIGVAPILMAGAVVVLLFFAAFGGWAALAPLKSAALANGTVIVESNRKTIKHFEGGIVAEIFVSDGDAVTKGETLIRLDVTQARVTLERLKGRMFAARALEARLMAERDGKKSIVFPILLLDVGSDRNNAEILSGQVNIFNTRNNSLASQESILGQQSAQLDEEILGLKGQINAVDTQLELIQGEIKDVKILVDKGLAKRPRLLALLRSRAEIEGARSQNVAAVARAKQQIAESKLRMSELKTQRLKESVEELRSTQTELYDLEELLRSAEDVLGRTNILAPLAGTIVGLQVHTRGGVIAPGEPLMDLVPSGAPMIIEARVDPNDIDVVHAGLPAQVRLTAFNQGHLSPMQGQVLTVSADSLTDERTGVPYFLTRIVLTADTPEDKAVALYPGMQAEVLIVTGERTVLDYVLKPISRSIARAFRED